MISKLSDVREVANLATIDMEITPMNSTEQVRLTGLYEIMQRSLKLQGKVKAT